MYPIRALQEAHSSRVPAQMDGERSRQELSKNSKIRHGMGTPAVRPKARPTERVEISIQICLVAAIKTNAGAMTGKPETDCMTAGQELNMSHAPVQMDGEQSRQDSILHLALSEKAWIHTESCMATPAVRLQARPTERAEISIQISLLAAIKTNAQVMAPKASTMQTIAGQEPKTIHVRAQMGGERWSLGTLIGTARDWLMSTPAVRAKGRSTESAVPTFQIKQFWRVPA